MLRRSLGTLAATALTVAGLTLPTPAQADDPTRILIIGDSVTNGSVGDYTWRYRLWNNLTGPGGADVDFVGPNVGVLGPDEEDGEGDTVDSMLYADPDFDTDHAARWGMSLAFPDHPPAELVEDYAADVVVVDMGLNDLTWLQGSPDVVADIERRWVGEMRSANPGVSVVLAQLPQDWIVKVPVFNDLLEDVAAELDTPESRVVVAEAPEPFVLDTDTWDIGHPSATGEVKIAESVAVALAQVGVGSAPTVFPEVVNGPADAPVLSAVAGRFGVSGLSWSGALGASGVEWWRRDVTAGGGWVEVESPRLGVRPGRAVEWRVRAFKGAAVSPLWSNVVRVSRPVRGR